MHDLATLSNSLSISGATRVNEWLQKLNRGFLMSSMKVMSSPEIEKLFMMATHFRQNDCIY